MTAFPHTTVQAAQESWLAASTAEPVTIAWYRRMTDPLIDCLGPDRPVQSINTADLRAWRQMSSPVRISGTAGSGCNTAAARCA